MNKLEGRFSIRLDRVRHLYFDFNALAEFEGELGKPVTAFSGKEVGVREVRAMLWAGLLDEDPELTIRDAGKLLMHADGETLTEKARSVMAVIDPALSRVSPPLNGGSSKKKEDSTGKSSKG